jgi:hypothetical protein
LVDL